MNDMQAVREAASRMVAGDLEHMYGVCIEDIPQQLRDDMESVARDYLDLADPTLLTVEQLVERGGKCVGDDAIRFGDLCFAVCEVEGIIGVMVGREHLPRNLWPRTVGELRQLLLRMEKQ